MGMSDLLLSEDRSSRPRAGPPDRDYFARENQLPFCVSDLDQIAVWRGLRVFGQFFLKLFRVSWIRLHF